MNPDVLRLGTTPHADVDTLARRYGIRLRIIAADEPLPGSFWGDSEAGLIGDELYARPDTPLHSLLHELSHYVCMAPDRRADLSRDAGGDDAEECAVCYLQILLADEIATLGRERMLRDMDGWGYTFRLGSARAWFENDSGDARRWLEDAGLIGPDHRPTYRLRDEGRTR